MCEFVNSTKDLTNPYNKKYARNVMQALRANSIGYLTNALNFVDLLHK